MCPAGVFLKGKFQKGDVMSKTEGTKPRGGRIEEVPRAKRDQEIMNEFIAKLQRIAGEDSVDVDVWRIQRDRGRILKLIYHAHPHFLYVKVSSHAPYGWGVTQNRLEEMRDAAFDRWFAVLLRGSTEHSHLFTSEQVDGHIKNESWGLNPDGDYKVHDDPECLLPGREFAKLTELWGTVWHHMTGVEPRPPQREKE
jgi:hypothetical protein